MADETVSTEIVPADETVSADITKDPSANTSAELTDTQAQPDTELADEDSLTFSDGVIEKIAALSLREVDNVVELVATGLTAYKMYLAQLMPLRA